MIIKDNLSNDNLTKSNETKKQSFVDVLQNKCS